MRICCEVVAAVNAFGTPTFWLRYCSPAQTTPLTNSSNASSECRAIWDSGGPRLGPITVPVQSRLSGSSAMGQADAQTLGNALHQTYLNVGPLFCRRMASCGAGSTRSRERG
jgi:hypothetical protein